MSIFILKETPLVAEFGPAPTSVKAFVTGLQPS